MTDWGVFAAYGIPTAFFAGLFVATFWRQLGKEPHEPRPKSHPHSIRYLAERKRRWSE